MAKAAGEWAAASEGLSLGGQDAPQVSLGQPGSDIEGSLQVLACAESLGHLLLASTPCIFHTHIASATLSALSALIGDKSGKSHSRWDLDTIQSNPTHPNQPIDLYLQASAYYNPIYNQT